MAEERIKHIQKIGDQLFEKRKSLLALWQEVADHFYVERADFTHQRHIGADFAMSLTTSYPLMARRSLGDIFSTMLRPVAKDWFSIHTQREDLEDDAAKKWLEWAAKVMRRAMYARKARFDRATKEADHDFAAFGQAVLSCELNRDGDELLYRCWHLRDVAWGETYDGDTLPIHVNWEPEAWVLKTMFDGKNGRNAISDAAKKIYDKTPYEKIRCRRVIVKSDDYDPPSGKRKWNTPYVSIYYERENGHILEERGVNTRIFIIPRWQTVSGSQYAYSPATVAALPDARLIQAMTLTLLEAGEMGVRPPLITPGDVLRSDLNLYAGGVSTYDADYDEKTGEILRPVYTVDKGGFGFAGELRNDTRMMIQQAFFLDKVSLPPTPGEKMTAFETAQRMQEYIRNAMPIFSPVETEYNGALCDLTFETMKLAGAFGQPSAMPPALSKANIQFRFVSPLHDAVEQQKGQIFQQARGLIAEVVQQDPATGFIVDAAKALRDTLEGIGVPMAWMRSEDEAGQMSDAASKQQQLQQTIDTMKAGGDAATSIATAAQGFQQAAQPNGATA